MKTSDFYYELPEELIAQDPLEDRASSRLLYLNRESGEVTHGVFTDVKKYLVPGDTLVINDTKVIPARLYGVREGTLGKVEILLLVRKSADTWETLVKPGKKCKVGTRILFGSPDGSVEKAPLIGEVVDILEEGNRLGELQIKHVKYLSDILISGIANLAEQGEATAEEMKEIIMNLIDREGEK